jgi:hypothetical protein
MRFNFPTREMIYGNFGGVSGRLGKYLAWESAPPDPDLIILDGPDEF